MLAPTHEVMKPMHEAFGKMNETQQGKAIAQLMNSHCGIEAIEAMLEELDDDLVADLLAEIESLPRGRA